MLYQKMTIEDRTFWVSEQQAKTIELLSNTNAGGFATVKGYVSTSKRVTPETADITFISRFSVKRLYQRAIAALEALSCDDIMDDIRDNPKIKALSTDDLYQAFDDRKAIEIASMQKSLDGVDRDDAHRQAHDRCYVTITEGVKVHFVTETVDKIKEPVLTDGLPMVESIMLGVIQVSKKVIVSGEYKVVNSGVPVILSDAMKRHLPKSAKYKNISLKDDNFTALHLDNMEYLPEDFSGLFTD